MIQGFCRVTRKTLQEEYNGRFAMMRHSSIGMKVERKLSDFSAEKRKRNENMKTETEICGTEFFWRKWKRKWNGVFWWNRCGNGSFYFWLIWNFRFMVFWYGQSSRPNM
jgi:hypothetical protein